MGKTLKLGFAMGGGVSLGTFSGAALTQAIKLAIVYGKDREGQPYDRVVVDVFSGASAGSMALSVMLRGLLEQSEDERQRARVKLEQEFGSDFQNLMQQKKEDLIAAQVAQDFQESIWVYEINLNKLLGKSEHQPQKDLRYKASLFDRGAVDDIARKYFDFTAQFSDRNFQFENRRVLGSRILFAHTLSNLTKLKIDAKAEYPASQASIPGLEDGLTSDGHKDLRVFDLIFDKVENLQDLKDEKSYPKRWCRYHLDGEAPGNIGDLRRQHTWSKLIATSIACGTFPFAFEPVVLNRSNYEFGERLWPKELASKNITSYPFTYVDGGTFNNEPIREAFRLASFIDSHDSGTYDRKIIFVDPNVGIPRLDYYDIQLHKEFKIQSPNKYGALDGFDLVRLCSLDRMLPHVGTMLTAILNESRVIEGDRIFQVRNRFADRKEFREKLSALFAGVQPEDAQFTALQDMIVQRLDSNSSHMMIPTGALTLRGELRRVAYEFVQQPEDLLADLDDFLAADSPASLARANVWLMLHFFILLDLITDLDGKDQNAEIIAIAPVVKKDDKLEIVDLPGRLVRGFGGFASIYPGQYEVKLARYCARFFMEEQGIILPKPGKPEPYPVFKEEITYRKELKTGLEDLGARVSEIIKTSHILNITPGLDKAILHLIDKRVQKAIRSLELSDDFTSTFLFKVDIPAGDFEFDGNRRGSDVKPLEINGKRQLVTEVTYHFGSSYSDSQRWEGIHINSQRQLLVVDKDGFLRDKSFCTIELPDRSMVDEALLYPNPIFRLVLTDDFEGLQVSRSKWSIEAGVLPLEDHLFRPVTE